MNNNLIYNVNDRPKFFKVLIFALQELLAIIAATLLVPVLVSTSVGIELSPAAALAGAGVGTIIYVIFTKGKSPIFLGSSFAFINSMIVAMAGAASAALGFAGLIVGGAMAGFVYVLIAILVKIFGTKWVSKLMPAVIIGPTVAIIGLSLSSSAISNLMSGSSKYITLALGILALIITTLCSVYGKKFAKLVPFIIGIVVVYILAVGLQFLGEKCEISWLQNLVNLENLKGNFSGTIGIENFFEIPEFTIIKALDGFKELNGDYIAVLAVAYVPVAFVVFAEHIADHENISTIIGKDLIQDPGLHRTLLGDGIGSAVGCIVGGCPNTSYGESIACVAISKNASVVTSIATAILAILLSFFKPFVLFVDSIPTYIMGGISIALYGFIAVSGLKMIQNIDLGSSKNLFIVSTILVAGIGGLSISFATHNGTITITNIACALLLGILLNLILREKKVDPVQEEINSMKLETPLETPEERAAVIIEEIKAAEKEYKETKPYDETTDPNQLQFNFNDGKIYCVKDMPKDENEELVLGNVEKEKEEPKNILVHLAEIYKKEFADYDSMTVIELREIAKGRHIKGCFRMKKRELIEALKDYDKKNK